MIIFSKIKNIFSAIWHSIVQNLPEEFNKLRVRDYNQRGCKIHKNVWISPNVIIKGKFEMDEGSSIAQNCTISGENAGVFIGKDVMIAPNVVIVAFNHETSDITVPMAKQGYIEKAVIIEDDVWISSNTTIGMGVRIGKGAIVGANSFVNKDVDPYTIVGGVPAKFIKERLR